MTADLTHSSRTGGRIEDFYLELHRTMYDLGSLDDAPFPSAAEFRSFLTREYARGMGGLCCLDAGCGATAINTRSLLAAGAGQILAFDISQRSVQLARTSLAARLGAGSGIAAASLLAIPFPDATFDFIVCSGVAHHTPDPELAMRELRRVLKPSGRLYISLYCFEGSMMFVAVKAWRAAARVVPFKLMHRLFRRSTIVNNFVLDHMYVPILWVFRERDAADALQRSGFSIDVTFVSALDSLHGRRIGPWSVTGDGLLRVFVCRPDSRRAMN